MSSTTTHSVYPFLTLRATNEYEYHATRPGDLRLFLEAVRADQTLLPIIKQIHLSEEYDDMEDSGVVDFAATYTVKEATFSLSSEDSYESDTDEEPIASISGDPFETAVENFRLANGVADGPPTEEMYEKLLEELLAVFTESEMISCPMGWNVS